jgi:hypothetical protein
MRRALLCACSDYRDPAFTPLKYPLNDIEEIRHLLAEPELCGFEDIELLANPGRGEAHEAVEHLTADSSQDDLILFYFSGHGKLAQDGSVSLVLSDTKENRLHSTGLLDDQLRVLFNASRARQRVIILDCCYSGAVGEESFKRASGDAVEAMAHQIKGTFILTASSKFQPAMECNETRGSAFTSCLVEGVRSGSAAEKDTGCVTLSKLGEYLAREVPLRSNQQPKFWDFGGVGGTVLARVPSGFDGKWTEQTLKRLRQMMSREQIDDALFVELQQVLRRAGGEESRERLALIDELVQRRIKPLPFLRKWNSLGGVEAGARPQSPPASIEEAQPPRAQAGRSVVLPIEPTPLPTLEPGMERSPTFREAACPVSSDERPMRAEDSPARTDPTPAVETPGGWAAATPPTSETTVGSKSGLLDFVLAGAAVLLGIYMVAGGWGGEVVLISVLVFIGMWARLWQHMSGAGGHLILVAVTLAIGLSVWNFGESDNYFIMQMIALNLWGFALLLVFVSLWRKRSS